MELTGTMLAALDGLSSGALFAPFESPEAEVRHGQLPVPSDCRQIAPGSGCGLPWLSLLPGRRSQPSYLLAAYSEHFLNCFGQNQVDYLKPLIRLLKTILLALGLVFFLPEVS